MASLRKPALQRVGEDESVRRSALGLHVIQPSVAVDAVIRAAPWAAVKSLASPSGGAPGAPLATAAAAGIPIRILRLFGIEQMGSSAAVQRWLQQDLTHASHLQLCCESDRGDDPVWQGEVIAGLRAGGYGGRYLVGNFPTGNPAQVVTTPRGPHFPQLEPLYPLLQQSGVDLGLDEYTGILETDPRWSQWAPWTVQRHRVILEDLGRQGISPDVYILESGGDNVPPEMHGGGWQARGWRSSEYVALLRGIDRQDQQDSAVQCRCLFTLGATPDWASYEIAPIVGQLAMDVKGAGAEVAAQMDYAGAIWAPSPNFWAGRQGQAITAIVLHGTAGPNAVAWFADPKSQVSAHYVVHEDGTVTQCVREVDSAWHAGVVTPNSVYASRPNPNLWSIGVEHVRNQTNSSPLTAAQIAASLALCRGILQRHPAITAFIPHDAIDVGRVCPGPGFPLGEWQALLARPAPAASPATTPAAMGTEEQAAWSYYTQLGHQVDRQHAIWTACLLPLYTYAAQLKEQANALADLVMPGPLVSGEEGAMWGGSRPAAVVRLSNRVVGVYQADDGTWRPYQAER